MLEVQVNEQCDTKLHSVRFKRLSEEIPRCDRLSAWKRVVVKSFITVCTKASVELKRNAQLQISHSVEKRTVLFQVLLREASTDEKQYYERR